MPFEGERAQSDAYIRLAKDRSLDEKIAEWSRIAEPINLAEDVAAISVSQSELVLSVDPDTVTHTIAVDGSPAESGDPEGLGSTIGFFVVAAVYSDRKAVEGSRRGVMVDPSELAKARTEQTIHGVVPGARVAMAGLTGQQTWRRAIDEFFFSHAIPHESSLISLADMYLLLMGSDGRMAQRLALKNCPECGLRSSEDSPLFVGRDGGKCPLCKCHLYMTDSLLLHQEFNEQESNWTPLTRLMNIAERIATAGIVEHRLLTDPDSLRHTLIVTDGPLGVFGPQSSLSRVLQVYYQSVNARLAADGRPPLLMMGVEKSGQFYTHAQRISRLVEPGTVLLPTTDYISSQILFRGTSKNLYGQHEFYGRRFFYKDLHGDMKVLTVPSTPGVAPYSALGVSEDLASYPTLGVAVHLMNKWRSTQYEGAFMPLVEAHSVASLPRGEGRRILTRIAEDALTRGTVALSAAEKQRIAAQQALVEGRRSKGIVPGSKSSK